MFEWHAYGHVALDDSYNEGPISPSIPWDFFHVNSISLDPSGDGDFLISSRNTWAGYEIDGHTGQILWRLGGKHPSFHMGPGTGYGVAARHPLAAGRHDHAVRRRRGAGRALAVAGDSRADRLAPSHRASPRSRGSHPRAVDGQPGQRSGPARRRLVRGLGRTAVLHRIRRRGPYGVRSEHPLSGPVLPRIHLPLDGDAREPAVAGGDLNGGRSEHGVCELERRHRRERLAGARGGRSGAPVGDRERAANLV